MGEAFMMRRGGVGSSMNIKVLGGTSQPPSPKENTIWINTDVNIPMWIFSAYEPYGIPEGTVWIMVGSGSAVEINAVKENMLMVYPISCKQYVSGSFQVMDAYAFVNSAWTQFSTVISNADFYIFKDGVASTQFGFANAYFENDYIRCTCPLGGLGENFEINAGMHDLTNYKTISIYCSEMTGFSNSARIHIKVVNAEGTEIRGTEWEHGNPLIHTMDVSDLTGTYGVIIEGGNCISNAKRAYIYINEIALLI